MRLKKDFITQTIGKSQMMVAVGIEADNFHGIIKNNEVASFIVELLKKETTEEQIADMLTDEYDVDKETALQDVRYVIEKLCSIGAIE